MDTNLRAEIDRLHAQVCSGLADPNRILILYTLSENAYNVSDLANTIELPQSTVSRHLKVLRDRGMVTRPTRWTIRVLFTRRRPHHSSSRLNQGNVGQFPRKSGRIGKVCKSKYLTNLSGAIYENVSNSWSRHWRHNGS